MIPTKQKIEMAIIMLTIMIKKGPYKCHGGDMVKLTEIFRQYLGFKRYVLFLRATCDNSVASTG